MKRSWMKLVLAFAASSLVWLGVSARPVLPTVKLGPDEAMAVVGRPLTPVSYAGVARRTVRRANYYP